MWISAPQKKELRPRERQSQRVCSCSGFIPGKGLFSLMPFLSKDPYTEEKWAISKPNRSLDLSSSWSSSPISHKNGLLNH